MGGGGFFWKYPNWGTMFFLMEKMQKDSIVVLNLDFFEFRAINEFWRAFVKKSAVSARRVKFVTAASRNAPIMENFG